MQQLVNCPQFNQRNIAGDLPSMGANSWGSTMTPLTEFYVKPGCESDIRLTISGHSPISHGCLCGAAQVFPRKRMTRCCVDCQAEPAVSDVWKSRAVTHH